MFQPQAGPRRALDGQPSEAVDRRHGLIIELHERVGDWILRSPAEPGCGDRDKPVIGVILKFYSSPQSIDHIIKCDRREVAAIFHAPHLKAVGLICDLNISPTAFRWGAWNIAATSRRSHLIAV